MSELIAPAVSGLSGPEPKTEVGEINGPSRGLAFGVGAVDGSCLATAISFSSYGIGSGR